jgi:hypothetical protein
MSEKSDAQLQEKIDQLKSELVKNANPIKVAGWCGMEYIESLDEPCFEFLLFGELVVVNFPELIATNKKTGQSLNIAIQALTCYYMATADGFPLEGCWISFAELPDGRFYNQAFQGYTGNKIAESIGNDIAKITEVSYRNNGTNLGYGDVSFRFDALPRVPLALVYWRGDDDFSPSCKILFDSSVSHYLPTDVCAILGSILTRKLLF